MSNLKETTLRDFGGGWNVSDSDKALSSRYQTVSDNVIRGTDGHFKIRQGYRLFSKLRNRNTYPIVNGPRTLATTSAQGRIRITSTAHGLASGDHVTIAGLTADVNGIPFELINGTHGIRAINADTFDIYVRFAASSTGSVSRAFTYQRDTHVLSGRTIFGRYYKDHLIVFAENGEIAAVDINGVATRIWSYQIAQDNSVEPWSFSKRISAEIIRGRLIVVNGADGDKPLAIDGLEVNYLVDAASLSNAAIPRAEFVIAANQYVVLVNTEYGPTMLEIGAKNTVFTGSRDPNPDDAVELDLGMMTQTVDNTILGASVIRSRVFVGFADRSMLGTLGIYSNVGENSFHEPDFADNIAEFGTFSHHSIVSLGNDLFCAGMNGINSLEVSRGSGEFVPQTISDLIHPVMLRHFFRLNEDDRRYRVFSMFDPTSRHYMLFAPKYSNETIELPNDPLIITSMLQQHNLAYLTVPNHKLDAGDQIDVAGIVSNNPNIDANLFNGRRKIRAIVDRSTIVIEVDPYVLNINQSFGSDGATIKPVNDETIGYVYEYNPRLKIRRWSRFRGMDFDWGARSQFNRLFFGKNGDIWQMGDGNTPLSADRIGDYDFPVFENSKTYTAGQRVKDNMTVFIAARDFVAPATGSFADIRADDQSDTWSEYQGEPISWELETAWADFDLRMNNKQIELVGFDTEGTADFEFSIFTNSLKYDFESLLLAPSRQTVFVGGDGRGFGAGEQLYGGGRNTEQEWLHSIPTFGKLFKLRFAGKSLHPLQINAVTMFYHRSRVQT